MRQRGVTVAASPARMVVALTLAATLTVAVSEAHRVELTVQAVGRRLEGTVSYHGGRPAAAAWVELRRVGGEVVATVRSDADGRFVLPLVGLENAEVVALTADGHAARLRLAREVLPAQSHPSAITADDDEVTAQRVAQLVGEEVGRQLLPLSDRLASLEQRIALRDVLGGVGYLVGVAGVVAYLLARRRGGSGGGGR